MSLLWRPLRRLAAACRGAFSIITPFVASNAMVRNNQFVSLFFLLIIFLSSITLMVNGLVSVRTTLSSAHVKHQFEYAVFVFVLIEVVYWVTFICTNKSLNLSWRAIRWRLSQDFGGFICCADIPEYKKNHLQNHLLYGSFLIAMIISSYCFWLLGWSLLLYTGSPETEGLSFYAVVGDCLMSIALVFHIWIQLVVAFYFRKGHVTAVCHTLSAIIWLVAINFVLYLQITMSEALEVKHTAAHAKGVHSVSPLERCRTLNSTYVHHFNFLDRHHREWIRPLGYALTVEFVLTLNTVFFSLWYHARDPSLRSLEDTELEDIIEISLEGDEEFAFSHEALGQITLKPERPHHYEPAPEANLMEVVENHKILLDVNYRKYSLPMSRQLRSYDLIALTRSENVSRNSADHVISTTEDLDVFQRFNNQVGTTEDTTPSIVASPREQQNTGRKSQVSFASASPSEDRDIRRKWTAAMANRRRSVAVRKDPRNVPFVGAIVGAVVCTPLLVCAGYAYTISKKYDQITETEPSNLLAFSAKLYESAIMLTQGVLSVLFMLSLVALNKLTPSRKLKIHEKIDIILLLITMTGMVTLSSFAMSSLLYPWKDSAFAAQTKHLKLVTGFEVLLGVVQIFFQTMFIAKAFATDTTRHDISYVNIFGVRMQRKRVGKILTELSMLFTVYSVLMWFINAFYERRSYSMLNRIATTFYPEEAWFAITEVTYPMCICYYYHSMICFIAIINKFASPW